MAVNAIQNLLVCTKLFLISASVKTSLGEGG